MGVGEDFRTLCSNLIIDNVSEISKRYRTITWRLNQEYYPSTSEVAHSMHIGSYGRDTAIKDAHDMDMYFLLPYETYVRYNGYAGNGQSALLQSVRSAIMKTYPSTDIGGDGQVVVARFSDRMRFEVLPAFLNTDKSITYPDANSGGTWKIRDPIPEIEAINTRNGLTNWNLKHLCRMARAWRRFNHVDISGLQIDTFAYQFIDSWQYKGKSFLYYDFLTRDFFQYLSNIDRTKAFWLAPGSGQRVYRKGSFELKANEAYGMPP